MTGKSLFSYSFEEFQRQIESLKMPKYRAKQVWDWVFKKFVFSYDEMTNLSKIDRELLRQHFPRIIPGVKDLARSTDGTCKVLIELADKELIEAVGLPDKDSMTFCISSQVGCNIGCLFCRTGQNGFVRNLNSSEILLQVMMLVKKMGARPTNIVFMGMGEPFLNKKEVFAAIDVLTDPKGLGLATRRITISTAGVVPGIYEMIDRPGEVNLAVSLHSVDEQVRSRLVPLNKRYPLSKLKQAVKDYSETTGRRVTFEMVLLKNINDQPNDAFNLVQFCQGINCHINIVRFNAFSESGLKAASEKDDREFRKIIKKAGIPVTVRKSRGSDILAACGQLAGKK